MIKLPFVDRVKFFVERQFVKGAGFQLLVVAAVIGAISLLGGLALIATRSKIVFRPPHGDEPERVLNPPRETAFELTGDDRLCVLARISGR